MQQNARRGKGIVAGDHVGRVESDKAIAHSPSKILAGLLNKVSIERLDARPELPAVLRFKRDYSKALTHQTTGTISCDARTLESERASEVAD